MKRVAILQSNYIPWKGYFDLINAVDEFIFYDDVQYTHHDWRNRNQIKTEKGRDWISIPIKTGGNFGQRIDEAQVSDTAWPRKHWDRLRQVYRQAGHFRTYSKQFEELFLGCSETYLSRINRRFIDAINAMLGIKTPMTWSTDYQLIDGKSERLVSLCRQAGATVYVSGPSAADYLQQDLFTQAGIAVEWADYTGYPPYRQLYGDFQHGVSVIDLIFNEGPDAPKYMKSFAGGFTTAVSPKA